MAASSQGRSGRSRAWPLLAAAHPGPAFAVTAVTVLLAPSLGVSGGRLVVLAVAALAGQLSVGWSNDAIDADRDRRAGRTDKPIATGRISARTVHAASLLALGGTIAASLACGMRAGLVHLGCVTAGWLYNLGFKSTIWSWAPFAAAFAGLPIVVASTAQPPAMPPGWMIAAGALLGIGAHLLNVLPDLDDDRRTGIRGAAHRLGPVWSARLASLVLAAASILIVVAAPIRPASVAIVVLLATLTLAAIPMRSSGRAAFRASIAIAVIDVASLLWIR